MDGICTNCEKAEKLKGCPVCGASICSNCMLDYGCKLCKGIKQFK